MSNLDELEDRILDDVESLSYKARYYKIMYNNLLKDLEDADARKAEQAATILMCEGVIGLFTLYINENLLIRDFEDWAGTVARRISARNPEANGNVLVPQEDTGATGSVSDFRDGGYTGPGCDCDLCNPQEGPAPAMDEPVLCDCDLCNPQDMDKAQTESSW